MNNPFITESKCCFCGKNMNDNDIAVHHKHTKNIFCRECIKIGYEAEKILRGEKEEKVMNCKDCPLGRNTGLEDEQ